MKLKLEIWQNARPGNKYPVVFARKKRQWHVVRVGHCWAHWQSAAKEGRALLTEAKG